MPNISIVQKCTRSCSYCFASALPGTEDSNLPMSLALFSLSLDCLKRSGMDQVCVLGGEPTLHPEFTQIVGLSTSEGRRLLLFSNGLMPEAALRCLEACSPRQVMVLVNYIPPLAHQEEEAKQQQHTLARLGARAMLGVNLHDRRPPLHGILSLIEKHSLVRSVRLGLAHPLLSGRNSYLLPKFYPQVGESIAVFAEEACSNEVQIEFDCGFVPCMFPSEAFKYLGISPQELGRRCNPLPDILPDGRVIACYPLAPLQALQLDESRTCEELQYQFEQALKPYHGWGIYSHCASCHLFLEGACCGGCRAAALLRLRGRRGWVQKKTSPAISLPLQQAACEISSSSFLPNTSKEVLSRPRGSWVIPYVDQPLDFWQRIAAQFGSRIQQVYFPLPGNLVGSGRPPLPNGRLQDFLRHAKLPASVLINPMVLPRPVEEIGPQIIAELKQLNDTYGLADVTVSNLLLARRVRDALPELSITASVLMDVATPYQAGLLDSTVDRLVVPSRLMRNLPALQALRQSFPGRLRLIVNEGCLPGCPLRLQHFYEMAAGLAHPRSLCAELLEEKPWLRLIGSWVLPQHLSYYRALVDEFKLAGRVTLQDPARYLRVLEAYIKGSPLGPHEIGGGPASPVFPMAIEEEFYVQILRCGQRCDQCRVCQTFYEKAASGLIPLPNRACDENSN